MPATIRDVARECGCSITTVSYVINNGPRGVHPETKKRVLEAMARLRYHPSAVARGLNRKHLDAIGIVFPHPEASLVVNPFFGGVLDGIIKVAAKERQNVTLYTGLEWRGAEQSLPAFRDRRVDGLLLLSPRTNTDIVSRLTEAHIPLVVVSSTGTDKRITSVDVDNAAAARIAVTHLLALGHRRIGLLAGEPNAPSTPGRRQGYLGALASRRLAADPALMLDDLYEDAWSDAGVKGPLGFYDESWGHTGMGRLLALPDPPSAVFAENDMIARGAYRACSEAGVGIPERMSIVGFDDTPLALHVTPPLTTVRQPMADLGATAARLLLETLRADPARRQPAQKITLPAELIVRGSTQAPPGAS